MVDVIRVRDVSKRFRLRQDKSLKERVVNFRRGREHVDEFWALRHVDTTVEAGTTVALIGHNGSGKSTLLKCIGGIIAPTEGYVERRGRLAALLELGAGFHPDLTGRENVYLNASVLGLTKRQTDAYFDAIVDFSGIEPFIDTQVKFYSSGMYVRLAFAVAVYVDPEILLVDEVLAVGDEAFQQKCMDKIGQFQSEGRTILFVTHALDTVKEICDRAIVLDHGVVVLDGTPVDAVRRIRGDFEGEIQVSRDAARDHGELAAVAITDVEVLGSDGEQRRTFSIDDPLVVEYTVSAAEPLHDWFAGIGIENQADVLCFGVNSRLLGISMPDLHGSVRVRFTVPDLPLADGNYSVNVAVAESRGRELRREKKVAHFTVRDDLVQMGVVRLRPAMTASRVGSPGPDGPAAG